VGALCAQPRDRRTRWHWRSSWRCQCRRWWSSATWRSGLCGTWLIHPRNLWATRPLVSQRIWNRRRADGRYVQRYWVV